MEYDVQRRPIFREWDAQAGIRAFTKMSYSDELDGLRVRTDLPVFVGTEKEGTSEVEYDVLGRAVRHKSAAADIDETSYSYIARESITHLPSEDIVSRYDLGGRLVETVDGAGTSSCVDYTSWGRIGGVAVNPAGGCGGNLGQTGPEHVQSVFEYDALGHLVRQERAGLAAKVAEFNAFGEAWRVTDPDGPVTVQRDGLGRMLQRVDPEGGVATFEWDSDNDCTWADGLLRRHALGGGAAKSYDYDRFGRVRAAKMSLDGDSLDARFSYDEFGRLVDSRLPDGGPVVRRSYDDAGYLDAVELDGVQLWASSARSPTGRLLDERFANGVETQRTFTQGLLRGYETIAPNMTPPFPGAGSSMSTIDSLEVGYDGDGRIDHRGVPHLDLEEDFTYDAAGRLETGLARHAGSVVDDWQHTYSSIGTTLTRSAAGGYQYESANAPLGVSRVGSVSYEYDTKGRQTLRNNVVLSWSPRDKLLEAAKEIEITSFEYDAFDQRVRKVEAGSVASDTLYFAGLERRTEGDATVWNYYVPGENGPIALARRSQQGSSVATWETFFLHSNNLGSSTIVTDAVGAVVQRQAYDPFGRERGELWGAPDPQQNVAGVDVGFTGHRKQESFGLLDMGGRFYDPHAGRFASPDPYIVQSFSSQAHDPYTYVSNDPLRFVDPSGYAEEPGDYDDGDEERVPANCHGPCWVLEDGRWVSIHRTVVEAPPAEPGPQNTGGGFSDGMLSDWSAPPREVEMPDPAAIEFDDLAGFWKFDFGRIFPEFGGPHSEHFREPPASLDGSLEQLEGKLNAPHELAVTALIIFAALDLDKMGDTEGAWELLQRGLDRADMQGVGRPTVSVGPVLPNPASRPLFGHSFSKHGAGTKKTASLTDTAMSTGKPQGQWLNDQKAALVLSEVGPLDGPATIQIPAGLGQVVMPNGSLLPATHAIVVPSKTGIRSAYPVLSL